MRTGDETTEVRVREGVEDGRRWGAFDAVAAYTMLVGLLLAWLAWPVTGGTGVSPDVPGGTGEAGLLFALGFLAIEGLLMLLGWLGVAIGVVHALPGLLHLIGVPQMRGAVWILVGLHVVGVVGLLALDRAILLGS